MPTGLFSERSRPFEGKRAGGRAKIWTDRNIAALCDVIADGGSFADAAARCKVSEMQARGRFRTVAKALGEHADG